MTPKKVMSPAGFVFWRAALTLAAALFLGAVRAGGALQFDAFLGYDDVLPQRSWFPITCELHNDGPPFNAVIEVAAEDFGRGQVRRLALDLPTNTRKRVFIPVFSTAREWNVRLLDEHGQVRAEQNLQLGRPVRNDLPLVAGLARTMSGLPVFPDVAVVPGLGGRDTRYSAARLQTALFPDNPLALEGINLLYLNSEKAADLSLGQCNALMAWLEGGGHLVVGVEQLSDVNATPWLRDLLPCELASTTILNAHDGLQLWAQRAATTFTSGPPNRPNRSPAPKPWGPDYSQRDNSADDAQFASLPLPVVAGAPRGDGKIVIGGESTPLAIEGDRGRGKITVLLFSPEREPFVSWKNRVWFWAGVAGIPANAFQGLNGMGRVSRYSSDGIFGAMIDSKQVRKLPLGWLLALLAAYLVVIGPLDHYWLKKINRQMLTWVTFPCYVVIFSALIYYIGFHLRAGELEWNELSVIDVLPDGERAVLRGQTYVSIYSPNNAHYPLAGQQKFAALRGEYLGNFGGNQESSHAVVEQTGNNFEADAFVPVWTSQLFVNDWFQPSALPLDMKASRQGSSWKVSIQNKLDRPLPVARAVLGGKVYDVGPLAAGASKTVTVDSKDGTPVAEMVRRYGGGFNAAVQARHSSFGNNASTIGDVPAGAMAASFLSYLDPGEGPQNWNWNSFTAPASLDLGRFAGDTHAILLAWDAGHSLTTQLNQFQPRRTHRDTLLRLVTPVKLN
jgi:hypothetical protein